MALDLAVMGLAARKAGPHTLAPLPFAGPPLPPPIPPTSGMYLPGPPPPGVLLPRPIVYPPDPEALKYMDECRSRSLIKFISGAGIVPSLEDERRRERVVRELGKIVMDWAKKVAYEQGGQYWITTATVLTYGSYDLGAYGPESDIDALCVGPSIALLQYHFFVVLRKMLEGRPEVSELHSIEGAKVPLMRFKFNGILIDFPYVQLPVINAAEVSGMAMDAFDPRVLESVDVASWRCLSGVRVNRQIIQLVPNIKDIRNTDIDWNLLFAPFPYGLRYKCFLRIVLSAPVTEELRDWVGWVKSRFRNLLLKLESLGIYCDPDPSEQVDHTIIVPNVVFFWGLMYRGSIQMCTDSLKEDFMRSILNNIYGKEKCAHSDIAMSIVGPPQLPKTVFDHTVYSENLLPYMMVHQLMRQDNNAAR
ncbi:hypothetical protein PR202_ga25933 [Eleusine coracana subsp. coracana]|uniref:Polynucleotide adenylyltransferase n=1 Tax=Eleusine coracana subsp. coracana TaxID=191504 RepID=A0AAV5DCX7_ELECO|nr:hypothetical protein PR202_ga25933 [Eleusine coracana subsp. coracana]